MKATSCCSGSLAAFNIGNNMTEPVQVDNTIKGVGFGGDPRTKIIPGVGISPLPVQDRLTARLSVIHERRSAGGNPTEVTSAFALPLKTEEQPYQRYMKLDDAAGFVALERGWLQDAETSFIVIQNTTGANRGTNPSAEELAAISRVIVEVWLGDETQPQAVPIIRPGAFFTAEIPDASAIRLRCVVGKASICVTVYPR